jgi:integrase
MSTRRGFGKIRRLPSGRHQASYIGPDDARHNAPGTFQTRGDADRWLAAQQTAIATGTWGQPAAAPRRSTLPTFGEYAERWLALRTGEGLAVATVASYRRAIRGHLIPALGSHRVDQIRVATVAEWYASFGSQLGSTRAKAYRVLMAIMHAAVAEEVIASSPCQIKRGSAEPRRAHHVTVATAEQVDTAAAAMRPEWRLTVLLAVYCQLRFGEIAELRRHDVDLDRGTIRVRRAMSYVDGEITVGPPKSEAGKRLVFLPPHLVGDLAAHVAQHARPGRNGLLFTTRDGSQLVNSKLHRDWSRARTAAGLPDAHFHDLRHTGATWLAQEGATTRELMRRLGHSTPLMAMRYQHPEDERDAALAGRLSRRAGVTPLRTEGAA